MGAIELASCDATDWADAVARFARFVVPGAASECWPFTGARMRKGHGCFRGPWRRNMAAHRFAWILKYREMPGDLCVLRQCDNPPCCNPAHLFLGTRADNNQDRKAKHRSAVGERAGNAKLTGPTVMEIRALYASGGQTLRSLGARFGIAKTHVEHIVKRVLWSHLP